MVLKVVSCSGYFFKNSYIPPAEGKQFEQSSGSDSIKLALPKLISVLMYSH